MFTILATGPWLPEQILVERIASSRRFNPEIEEKISEAWSIGLAQTPMLFDGPMCRMESFDASPRALHLHISPTSYRIFYGTNLSHPEFHDRFGPAYLANPIGLSAAVLTTDGYLIFGRRNSSVAYYPNRTHPIAGALEPSDIDPFSGIRREICEELLLTPEDVLLPSLLGMVSDQQLHQPELIFRVKVAKSLAELTRLFDAAEHQGIRSVRTDAAAIAAAEREGEFTPVGLATLALMRTNLP